MRPAFHGAAHEARHDFADDPVTASSSLLD
jgi:hypothetical protein